MTPAIHAADTDALRQWRSRSVFPTDLSSAELRTLSRELRMRSVFSARVTNAKFLDELQRVIDQMLSGEINLATGRLKLMRMTAQLGYDPEIGFPSDMAAVPPAERGSIQDISSEKRLDLMLETNRRVAHNYGRVVAGNTDYALRAYPAWELVRFYHRLVPRGTPESRSAGWDLRWTSAGDAVGWEGASRSRMIALKGSPIWQALGDGAGGYMDTLGHPFPPFAFNSGMGWRAVSKAEVEALNLSPSEQKTPSDKGTLSPGQKEVADAFEDLPPEMQEELRKELGL